MVQLIKDLSGRKHLHCECPYSRIHMTKLRHNKKFSKYCRKCPVCIGNENYNIWFLKGQIDSFERWIDREGPTEHRVNQLNKYKKEYHEKLEKISRIRLH